MQPAHQTNAVIRFGVFEADVRSGELRKNGSRSRFRTCRFGH